MPARGQPWWDSHQARPPCGLLSALCVCRPTSPCCQAVRALELIGREVDKGKYAALLDQVKGTRAGRRGCRALRLQRPLPGSARIPAGARRGQLGAGAARSSGVGLPSSAILSRPPPPPPPLLARCASGRLAPAAAATGPSVGTTAAGLHTSEGARRGSATCSWSASNSGWACPIGACTALPPACGRATWCGQTG